MIMSACLYQPLSQRSEFMYAMQTGKQSGRQGYMKIPMFFSLCRCTEISRDSPCYTRIPGRNSDYTYPQYLPGLTIRSVSVDVVVAVLESQNPPPNPACVDAVLHIICAAAFPPCDPSTQRVLPICNDSCRAYKQLMSSGSCDDLNAYVRLINATSSISSVREGVTLYFSFDCDNTSTYLFGSYQDLVSPNKCTDIISTSPQGTCFSEQTE